MCNKNLGSWTSSVGFGILLVPRWWAMTALASSQASSPMMFLAICVTVEFARLRRDVAQAGEAMTSAWRSPKESSKQRISTITSNGRHSRLRGLSDCGIRVDINILIGGGGGGSEGGGGSDAEEIV